MFERRARLHRTHRLGTLDLDLLSEQPIARFGQELRSRRQAIQWLDRDEKSAAIGAVENQLVTTHPGYFPTPRMLQLHAEVVIVIEHQRIVGVGLLGHGFELVVAQFRSSSRRSAGS